MKILHTADWHLGKQLEGYSRLDEQEIIMDQLVEIAEAENIDMVLVSGDIFDTFNPPAEAEKLYYKTLQRLADGGERLICLISGNHDSPNRLAAPSPLSYTQGIIIMDRPSFEISPGKVGEYRIEDSGPGYIKVNLNGEKVVLLSLPYPSESRLNTALGEIKEERDHQLRYSQKVGELFAELEENYQENTINIAMSHIFVAGGEESESERPIQVGGGMAVSRDQLPDRSQYTALGHLHRGQKISNQYNAYYAGSPLQYSASERNQAKSVNIIEVSGDSSADVEKVNLKNPKPIEEWRVESLEQARQKLRKNDKREVWAYLKIETPETLLQSEIKELKSIKKDLLSIIPLTPEEFAEEKKEELEQNLNIEELFREFYKQRRETEPDEEIMEMFLDIVAEGEEDYEA